MLGQRVLSALVGIPLIILAVWYGGIPLLLLISLLIILGIKEITELLTKLGLKPLFWLASAGGLILIGGAYLYSNGYPGPTITIILFLHLIATVTFYPRYSLLDGPGTRDKKRIIESVKLLIKPCRLVVRVVMFCSRDETTPGGSVM